MYVTGAFAFVVASPLCGLAPGAGLLIAARLLQGLAAEAMFPQVLAIMHVSFPEEKRAAIFGAFGAMARLPASPARCPAVCTEPAPDVRHGTRIYRSW
jgi:MFS family permease